MITTYSVQDIKLAAFNQTGALDQMNMAERILFLTLSDVYRKFRSGEISKLDGDSAIKEALHQYEADKAQFEMLNRISVNHAEMWRRIESAAAAYVMSGRRTEEADAFMESVYLCKLKQKGFDKDDT